MPEQAPPVLSVLADVFHTWMVGSARSLPHAPPQVPVKHPREPLSSSLLSNHRITESQTGLCWKGS